MMDRVRWSGESNGEAGMSRSPTPGEASTDEDGGIMLASAHPKKPAGRKKFKETRHPVYRGVRQRSSGKWVCEVREPQKKKSRIWLGTFPTPEMAARAHDVAAIALRGPGACLNFADSVHLPLPHSNDVKDIQRAASQAANAFQAPTTTRSTAHDMSTHDQYLSPQPISTNNNVVVEQQQLQEQEQVFYMDEDAVFGMPGLLADMYHGMMLPPPPTSTDTSYYHHLEFDAELPLWSYSI